jgi:hypothetical protein
MREYCSKANKSDDSSGLALFGSPQGILTLAHDNVEENKLQQETRDLQCCGKTQERGETEEHNFSQYIRPKRDESGRPKGI